MRPFSRPCNSDSADRADQALAPAGPAAAGRRPAGKGGPAGKKAGHGRMVRPAKKAVGPTVVRAATLAVDRRAETSSSIRWSAWMILASRCAADCWPCPLLRARYLDHVRTIARDWLDWNKLKPIVEEYRALIEKEIEADTRKLTSLAAFQKSVGETAETKAEPGRGRPSMNLQAFAEQRRKYLLDYRENKNAKP